MVTGRKGRASSTSWLHTMTEAARVLQRMAPTAKGYTPPTQATYTHTHTHTKYLLLISLFCKSHSSHRITSTSLKSVSSSSSSNRLTAGLDGRMTAEETLATKALS